MENNNKKWGGRKCNADERAMTKKCVFCHLQADSKSHFQTLPLDLKITIQDVLERLEHLSSTDLQQNLSIGQTMDMQTANHQRAHEYGSGRFKSNLQRLESIFVDLGLGNTTSFLQIFKVVCVDHTNTD